jgi:hypothetical protein
MSPSALSVCPKELHPSGTSAPTSISLVLSETLSLVMVAKAVSLSPDVHCFETVEQTFL